MRLICGDGGDCRQRSGRDRTSSFKIKKPNETNEGQWRASDGLVLFGLVWWENARQQAALVSGSVSGLVSVTARRGLVWFGVRSVRSYWPRQVLDNTGRWQWFAVASHLLLPVPK